MKFPRLFCGLLAAAMLTGCGGCANESGSAENGSEGYTYDACLIEKTDTGGWCVYIQANKEEESELSGIPVENAVFISHDKEIKERSDVEPGMMIRFTVPDNYQDLIGYGYFNQTSLIETWGKYQNDLYRTGLNDLRVYKEMENGLNY